MNPYKEIMSFVDCGAPSLYNKLSRKVTKKGVMGSTFSERKHDSFTYTDTEEYKQYRDDYIAFLHKYHNEIYVYSNLDVINNPRLTYKNQRILESEGLNPIPVYHLGSDVKWLKKYLDKYEYIALGGLVPNPTTVLIPILDRLFKDYLLDENGLVRVKLHGFACTSVPLMLRYPWYSVDSATCRKLAAYGSIALPQISNPGVSILTVTERNKTLKTPTPLYIKRIKEKCDQFHIKFEDLQSIAGYRTVFNYLIFLEILRKYGKPWRSAIAPNEKHDLDFYFAGALSKSEEQMFWEVIQTNDISAAEKKRLLTFFYKEQYVNIVEKQKL